MQRNMILVVCAVFCVVAVAAGYFVAGMSEATNTITTAQGPTSPSLGTPTAAASPAPIASATAAPQATAAPEATATSAATAAPEATATSAATAAPEATATSAATAAPQATAAPEATAAPSAAASEFVEYAVQRGDELQAIAKKYGVTVKDIIANNDIPNPDSLRVSQVLRIPKK